MAAQLQHKSRPNGGFALVEVLLTVSILGLLSGFVVAAGQAYSNYVAGLQLKQAVMGVAMEVRALQQRALVPTKLIPESFVLGEDQQSYRLLKNGALNKLVTFGNLGCSKVKISGKTLSLVSFSEDGAPSASGVIRFNHPERPGLVYKLEVQPVTGRVVVSKEGG